MNHIQDVLVIGEKQAAEFQKRMPDGFYKPLSKKVVTMEVMRKSIKVGDKQVYDMEQFYGRMIVLSQTRKLDLKEVFSFELAPVPSSLFDRFGDMRKGNKAKLVEQLEVTMEHPCMADVDVIDGNETLYQINWPKTGTVAQFCVNFETRVKSDHDVYVVFDHYISDSVKSHERERRADGMVPPKHTLHLHTPLPPKDTVLKSAHNKKQLIAQLCNRAGCEGVVMIGEEQCMFGHEEADVNIITYVLHLITMKGKKKIRVVSTDTDIFVMLLYFFWKHKQKCEDVKIMMQKGDKLLDINASAIKLGEKCEQLISLHAITGCDTASYPFGKGKVSALKLLQRNNDLHLEIIGNQNSSDTEVYETGRSFFNKLYGCNGSKTMNELRFVCFTKRRSTPKIKSLPPTDEALRNHLMRAHLQAMTWNCADEDDPPLVDKSKYGWQLEDGVYHPTQSNRAPAPSELLKIVACGCSVNKENLACTRGSCSCKSAGISCTTFCKCEAHEACQNEHTLGDIEDCAAADDDQDNLNSSDDDDEEL